MPRLIQPDQPYKSLHRNGTRAAGEPEVEFTDEVPSKRGRARLGEHQRRSNHVLLRMAGETALLSLKKIGTTESRWWRG
jgi:hypothetical protein